MPEYLVPKDAARYITEKWGLPTTTTTLSNWRQRKRGPDYIKIMGRPIYTPVDIDNYFQENIEYSTKRSQISEVTK